MFSCWQLPKLRWDIIRPELGQDEVTAIIHLEVLGMRGMKYTKVKIY
ncbi:hypothetical protein QUF95_06905 [Paenibacillus silvae]|nr:hypothetical protein [Paenibacillus silvae]MDM5277104.1 hypothetical protein [Paenibacillus silvae]